VIEDFSNPPILRRDHYFLGAPSVSLTAPSGASSVMTGTTLNGAPRLLAQSQAAGSGCAASTSSQAYDAGGHLASTDDFNGVRTCFANDPGRGLETTRVEGLPAGTPCTLTAAGSTLPAGSRKVSTQWHPSWPLKTRVAEPGRVTTFVYNGQPDPYAEGALASCAPSTALLPDGRPIAVLCRQVEQATTDANGPAGFAATAQAQVALRDQRWTYNASGQVLTHDGPRNDVADITQYDYYGVTSFSAAGSTAVGQNLGDLMRVTNPAGHVTRFTLYDRAGRLLQSVDPNGVVTDRTYDARGRILSSSVGGQTTLYAWWPTGLIQRITSPDGSWTFHEHDPARRLLRVSDNLGNSVSYTLDAMGQRTAETVTDPSGSLRRQVARTLDALGRVEQVTGRE
jgi:YD repeat-containing protein